MAAERINLGEPERARHLTLVATFEREQDAEEMLARLEALGLDTGAASLVRVALSEPVKRLPARRSETQFLPTTRYAFTGGILGSAFAIAVGLALYEGGVLNFSLIEGLVAHTLAVILLGAVMGAAVGALLASASVPEPPVVLTARSDGFIVVIRTPLRLAEQAEIIARRLGAKEIAL